MIVVVSLLHSGKVLVCTFEYQFPINYNKLNNIVAYVYATGLNLNCYKHYSIYKTIIPVLGSETTPKVYVELSLLFVGILCSSHFTTDMIHALFNNFAFKTLGILFQ